MPPEEAPPKEIPPEESAPKEIFPEERPPEKIHPEEIHPEERPPEHASDSTTAPMEVVGQFLDCLLKGHTLPQKTKGIISSHHLQSVSNHFSQPLYYSPSSSQINFVCLILKVLSGVPESYQIMRCQASTTAEELNLFLRRVETHRMQYLMLCINKLPFELQEVCARIETWCYWTIIIRV